MKETNYDENCRKLTKLLENNSESENKVAGHSRKEINSNGYTKGELLEKILRKENLRLAFKRVKSNKGSAGIDGVTTEELLEHLRENKDEIIGKIKARKYKPTPVRRVQIPKPNGTKRNLGIPTTTDRVIQQAITQVLSPIYEKKFSNNSYGFRPNRSAHGALTRIKEIADEGYMWVVDLDLEKFFDTVNQSKLIQILSEEIKDGDVISLINKFLKAGIMENGIKIKSEKGVPQGGPLSPLLANIYLNEADQEFETWEYKFVRYADDMLIFAKNRKAAERYYKRVKKYLEGKLKLKVNEEKTSIRKIIQTKYLGYGFYENNGIQFKVHHSGFKKFKAKLKEITGRSNGIGHVERRVKLNQVITGWIQYFKLANMNSYLTNLDGWVRRRIRMCAWKSWKKAKTRFRNLKKLGIEKSKAWQWANTRKSFWRVAGSNILSVALNNKRIANRGYISLVSYYNKVRIKL